MNNSEDDFNQQEPNFFNTLASFKERFGDIAPEELERGFYGRSFMDLMLLGFIMANEPKGDNSDTPMKRLKDARRALFGDVRKGKEDTSDDVPQLHLMADLKAIDQYQKTQNPDHRAKSIRELARIAAGRSKSDTLTSAEEDRLRHKFANLETALLEGLTEKGLETINLQKEALFEIECILKVFSVKFFGEF